MNCRNCGHRADEHPEGMHCTHATETSVERVECTCPAYNVRPKVAPLTETERIRVTVAQINDLDRQIGALAARREALARSLDAPQPEDTEAAPLLAS